MYLISFYILVFLLGGIPFGLLISRYWLKIDIRQQGSGNIGMTNVMRVGGKLPGLLTFLLDFGKGSLSVILAKIFVMPLINEIETQKFFLSLAGVIVVCGHVFSVFLRFKGGKRNFNIIWSISCFKFKHRHLCRWHLVSNIFMETYFKPFRNHNAYSSSLAFSNNAMDKK